MKRDTRKRKLKLFQVLTESGLLYAIGLSLSGCATSLQENSFCELYTPVWVSQQDTEETVSQVMLNNGVYALVCLGEDLNE